MRKKKNKCGKQTLKRNGRQRTKKGETRESISKNRRKEINELKYLSNWEKKRTSKVVKSEMGKCKNVIRGLQKKGGEKGKGQSKEEF